MKLKLEYFLFAFIAIILSSCKSDFNKLNEFYIEHSFDKYYKYEPDHKENEPLAWIEGDKILVLPYAPIPLKDVMLIPYGEVVSIEGSGLYENSIYFGSNEDCIEFINLANELAGK
jgi:hypothetical protein